MVDFLIAGSVGSLVTALAALILTRRNRPHAGGSEPIPSLTDRQLEQIERRQLREKILEKVSKRGLRGRPIL